MKTIFISDLHLIGSSDPRTTLFLSFLDREAPGLERLIIGGDLFDFWPGGNTVFPQYLPILNKLSELRQMGVEMYCLEGNHDFSLRPYFTEALKIHVISEEVTLKVGEFTVYIAHGDQVNRKDYGYLFLRWFLRTVLIRGLIRILPSSWIWSLGQKSSYASRTFRESHPHTIQLFREFARQKLETIDIVILGHTHHPDQQTFEIQGKQKYYYNTGDWLKHFTYLEFSDGLFSLKTLDKNYLKLIH